MINELTDLKQLFSKPNRGNILPKYYIQIGSDSEGNNTGQYHLVTAYPVSMIHNMDAVLDKLFSNLYKLLEINNNIQILNSSDYTVSSYKEDISKLKTIFEKNGFCYHDPDRNFLESTNISLFNLKKIEDDDGNESYSFDSIMNLVINNNKLLEVQNFREQRVDSKLYESESLTNFRKLWLLIQILASFIQESKNKQDCFYYFNYYLHYKAIIDCNYLIDENYPIALFLSNKAYKIRRLVSSNE